MRDFRRERDEFRAAAASWVPRLFAYFRRLRVFEETARDLTQETMLAAWANLGRLRDGDRMTGWMYGIAYRQFLRHVTRAEKAAAREVGEVSESLASLAGDPGNDERPALRDVRDAVLGLPGEFRAPLMLIYWEGLSYEEAAKALSLRPGTLAWRVHRGLELLRQALSEGEEDDGRKQE